MNNFLDRIYTHRFNHKNALILFGIIYAVAVATCLITEVL